MEHIQYMIVGVGLGVGALGAVCVLAAFILLLTMAFGRWWPLLLVAAYVAGRLFLKGGAL